MNVNQKNILVAWKIAPEIKKLLVIVSSQIVETIIQKKIQRKYLTELCVNLL